MLVSIDGADGASLDARIELEDQQVVLHSRGGAFGKPNLRNPDYRKALTAILARLLASEFQPARVLIDSRPAWRMAENRRVLIGQDGFGMPVDELVSEIGKRAAAFGRQPGATGHGNSTKRIRIDVPGASAARLRQVIEGYNPQVRSVREDIPPIVYFNVGWMKAYAGPKSDDPTIGGHAYLKDHSHGVECFNFRPGPKGILRGYRPSGEQKQVEITRLGAQRGDESVGKSSRGRRPVGGGCAGVHSFKSSFR